MREFPGADPGILKGGKRGVQPLTRGYLYWKLKEFFQKGGGGPDPLDPLDLPLISPPHHAHMLKLIKENPT
jgi:hypothetical protein